MFDSEDCFLVIDSDMEDNQIEQILSKKLEEEQEDNLLAYTAERLFHGGGTPPTADDKPTNPQLQVLFQQPKIAGVKCPIRSASNLLRGKRNEENKNFYEFYQKLDKDVYEAEELKELYNAHFPGAFITTVGLGRLKTIKNFFKKEHYQKKLKNSQGKLIKIDKRIYRKKIFTK